jgi:hypothetical protein
VPQTHETTVSDIAAVKTALQAAAAKGSPAAARELQGMAAGLPRAGRRARPGHYQTRGHDT